MMVVMMMPVIMMVVVVVVMMMMIIIIIIICLLSFTQPATERVQLTQQRRRPSPRHQGGGVWSAALDGVRGPVTELSLASRREAGERRIERQTPRQGSAEAGGREIEWVGACVWVSTRNGDGGDGGGGGGAAAAAAAGGDSSNDYDNDNEWCAWRTRREGSLALRRTADGDA